MGTRSTIWRVYNDGTLKGIYCHWDGYPSWNGKILREHYDTEEKVEELLALGNLSTLNIKPGTDKPHSHEKPADDTCVAYARDRGEEKCIMRLPYAEGIRPHLEQYNYFFKDGKWHLGNYWEEGKGLQFEELTAVQCMED